MVCVPISCAGCKSGRCPGPNFQKLIILNQSSFSYQNHRHVAFSFVTHACYTLVGAVPPILRTVQAHDATDSDSLVLVYELLCKPNPMPSCFERSSPIHGVK